LLYSFVSAALASIYVGTITLLAHVLQGRREPASAYSSALAAIFMTLLFNPLRIRAQRWVDRYFPRERLDPGLLQEAAGGFAHEMKRPLSKISLPAELALMDLERVKSGEIAWEDALPGFERRLRFIVSQSVDAGYMIEAIRELSASSASPFVPVDLREVINSVLSVEKDLLEKQAIVVNLRLPSDLSLVPGHARQLEIVFINLIKNAVEAMGDLPSDQRRELRIEGQSEQGQVIVRIIDTGPGIRPEEMEKIFQSQYSTKGLNGSGIGLYLSRQIVQAHGGTIDVRSEPGQGTEFILRFPQC
jgi:signal transduction histidine kinase